MVRLNHDLILFVAPNGMFYLKSHETYIELTGNELLTFLKCPEAEILAEKYSRIEVLPNPDMLPTHPTVIVIQETDTECPHGKLKSTCPFCEKASKCAHGIDKSSNCPLCTKEIHQPTPETKKEPEKPSITLKERLDGLHDMLTPHEVTKAREAAAKNANDKANIAIATPTGTPSTPPVPAPVPTDATSAVQAPKTGQPVRKKHSLKPIGTKKDQLSAEEDPVIASPAPLVPPST